MSIGSPPPEPVDRPEGARDPRRAGSRAAFAPKGSGPTRLLAYVRKAQILESIRQSGSVQVAEIAGRLAVSEMTIRRDLMDLERDGHLKRLHGGAVALPGIAVDRVEPSFDDRMSRDRAGKERVAAAALPLVAAARTVALDVGATTYLLAQLLRPQAELSLFTNSLRIATVLAGGPLQVYVPAGRVRGSELAIGGPAAVEAFEKLWFDVAFVGVSGITTDGLFDYSIEDSALKRVYLTRSSRKVVLCDASKFNRMSLVRIGGFDAIDVLVTDAEPPADIFKALRKAGVDVLISDAATPLS